MQSEEGLCFNSHNLQNLMQTKCIINLQGLLLKHNMGEFLLKRILMALGNEDPNEKCWKVFELVCQTFN